VACVHESFDLRPLQVRPHHSHAFSIAPVKLAVLLVHLELLGREDAAWGNDGDHVLAIEIRPENGAIIFLGIAHVGPVDISGGNINHNSVRKLPALVDDDFQIGTVRVCGEYTSAPHIQEKEPPRYG